MTVKNKQKNENDLAAFEPSPPEKKLDDKAVSLEDENQTLKRNFNRERFVYLFVIIVFFNIFVGAQFTGAVFGFSIVASLVLLIGLAKWLEFPWVSHNLERWHELFYRYCEKKAGLGENQNTEPLVEDNRKE